MTGTSALLEWPYKNSGYDRVGGLMSISQSLAGLTAIAMLVGVTACSPPAKEVTPQACIDALDRSGEMVSLVADWIDLSTQVNEKRMSTDDAAEQMEDLQPKIKAKSDAWLAAGDECRAKRE